MHDEFESIAIDRGFTLHVAPAAKFKTTSFRLVLRRNLRAGEHTLTAVVPFVLRRGTARYPTARDIARHLENLYGAGFGADISKIGETQNVELYVDVPNERFLPERRGLAREALAFLAEVLLAPKVRDGGFWPDYVAQEVQVLRRRIESAIDNKPQYAMNRLREEMCRDEPFGLHKYGDAGALAKVDPGELYAHYRRIIAESPVELYAVGPVEPGEVAGWVRELFALPRGQLAPLAEPENRRPAEEREIVEQRPMQQGILAMGFRTGTRYADDDYPALLVYNGILGGFPHSKLFVNLRERASLAYFASSQIEPTKGVLMLLAGIAPDRYEKAALIIREQVDALAQGAITPQELENTQKGIVNGLLAGEDSPHRITGSHLVGLVNGRLRPVAELIDAVKGVSRDDVMRVAEKILPDTVYFLHPPNPASQ
ncbi:MAG: insulinase family protein [Firmicutes bacterium]|nr:insulinase family protein [Bacillota bacterium]